MNRDDLTAPAKAALALIDDRIDALVAAMQSPESEERAAGAFRARPRVRIGRSKGAEPAGGQP